MATNIVTSIPLEITQAILSSCPDGQTLYALLVTSKFFFKAYRAAKSHILRSILQKKVKPKLLQDALLTLESHRPSGPTNEILSRYHHNVVPIPRILQLADLLYMERLMECVEQLTELLCSRELLHHPISNHPFESRIELNNREKNRIRRALLWFQTSCNFNQTNEAREQFHRYFAGWDLERIFTVAFWINEYITDACIELGLEITETRIMHVDIEKVAQLAMQQTPEDRQRVLYSLLDSNVYNDLLTLPLQPQTHDDREDDSQCWRRDSDDGPERAWKWAYDDERGELAETIQFRFSTYGVYFFDFDTLRRYNILSETQP